MAASPVNFPNAGHFYSNISKPVEIDLQFKVDAANTNGLGISSLKSNGYVDSVFMHTSQTPAGGNPNPAAGLAMVQLAGNYNKLIGARISIHSPDSGSAVKIDNSAMTAGQIYSITVLGNATLAKWQAIGLPQGVTPAVGVAFVAKTNGGSGNTLTSRVQAPSVSGIVSAEIIGSTDLSVNSNVGANGGEYVMLQFLAPTVSTGAYISPMIPTAPADGSIVHMTIKFDASSSTVDGL